MPTAANGGTASEGEAVLRALASNAGLTEAMECLLRYRKQYRPTSNPVHWAVINFDLHSAEPRLFLFDRVANTCTSYLCAHGKGSEGPNDDGYAEIFSNDDGSNCSSLGIYNCADTYYGEHGRSLHLDGLEATNFNARHRHIVIHGADYVSQQMIDETGRIGRSLGCPAVEERYAPTIIDALRGGSLMIAWKT
jgi:hypothetical protein